jgi:hypothetical protein
VRAPSALYSWQRYAARPSLLCRSPLALLQDAALARIAGEYRVVICADLARIADENVIILAAQNGDIERVRDIVIAYPTSVNDTCYFREDRYGEGLADDGPDTNECDARQLHICT